MTDEPMRDDCVIWVPPTFKGIVSVHSNITPEYAAKAAAKLREVVGPDSFIVNQTSIEGSVDVRVMGVPDEH